MSWIPSEAAILSWESLKLMMRLKMLIRSLRFVCHFLRRIAPVSTWTGSWKQVDLHLEHSQLKCDCLANRLLSLLPILTKVWKTPKCVNSLQREKCRQEKKAAWTLCQSKKSNGHSVSGELQSCTHTHVTHTRRQMLKFSKSYRLYKLNIRWVHSQRGVNPPHPTRKGLRKSTSTPCHCVIH